MVNIEMLNSDQITRLHDISECLDELLQELMTDRELLELLGVHMCFEQRDMQGCEVVFEEDLTDPTGHSVIAHLFPRLELPSCHYGDAPERD